MAPPHAPLGSGGAGPEPRRAPDDAGAHPHVRAEALAAFRAGLKLGSSLVVTWGVAIGVRILLPRYLGPAAFGHLNFADAFTVTAFVLASLGVDLHIRKEHPRHPEIGNDVFAGIQVVRVAVSAVLFAAIAVILRLTGRPPDIWRLAVFFGMAQMCIAVSGTLAAMLQAEGKVDGLSVANVVSKVLWAAGVLLGIATGNALIAVPVALFLSEAVKLAALLRLARKHARLRFRLDWPATRAALAASLPYYVNFIAFTAYGRIDVTVLAFAVNDDQELGRYSVAANLAGLCLLMTPLIGWVLLPLLARAAARNREALHLTAARSMEVVIALAIPAALLVGLGADLWIRAIFGAAYAPAAPALRILAAMFVVTYVAAVSACTLNVLGRGWLVTGVSLGGLLLNPVLNVLLVRAAMAWRPGPGAAGAGAALAMLISELLVATTMTLLLGASAFDRRSAGVLGRMVLAAAAVVALHRLSAALGPWRLLLDAAVYVALVFLTRAVRLQEMVGFVRSALRQEGSEPA